MSQYFPKPYGPFGGDINVKVDLSNYETKADLKDATGIDTSNFTLKSNLASLKIEVDKLDTDKLLPVPVDLSKLSDVVKNDVVKKTVHDKLVAKVIDISGFVLKTKYDTDKSDLEKKISDTDKKIPDANSLVKKKTDLNAKVSEIESKIPNITGLATNSALIAVENKMPDVSSLVKKTDYDGRILDIEKKVTDHDHDEYITTSEFNNLAAKHFTATLAQANLVTKTDFDDKLKSFNKKINSNKIKHLLVENEFKKLQKFDSGYFCRRNYFVGDDGTQNYLVLQPMNKYFDMIAGVSDGEHIYFWRSKGLSDENINSITASNYSITPELSYLNAKLRVKLRVRVF